MSQKKKPKPVCTCTTLATEEGKVLVGPHHEEKCPLYTPF